jgi:hypothetical protein
MPHLAMDVDAEVDNDIDEDNLNIDHDDVEIDANVDTDHDDDVLLYFCSNNNILGMAEFASCALVVEELDVVSSDEPTSFVEAKHSPSWMKAMMEEMTSIKENGTWSLVDPPPGRKLIEGKVGVQGETE